MGDRGRKMFALLILPSAALAAWRPAPGIPLERQLHTNRQTSGFFSNSGSEAACDFDPWIMECNGTDIWCDSGYYNDNQCWFGNYCIPQVNEWDGCHCVCPMNCNWETEDWCDMGTDSAGCWMGNWCQYKGMGGCPPPMGGSEMASGEDVCAHMTWTEECNGDQISCDSGYSNEGCWFGNYCIYSVNSWDNCPS